METERKQDENQWNKTEWKHKVKKTEIKERIKRKQKENKTEFSTTEQDGNRMKRKQKSVKEDGIETE